jgi:hypothetical protein
MADTALQRLVEDAELVADVGVRLGRIKDAAFLTALSNARLALDSNTVSPSVVAELQRALNTVVKDIAPITLNDLRSGWRPFDSQAKHRIGTLIFGPFCLLLLVVTAYTTQIYDRASSLYATTLELQDARGAEQAIRLLGLLRKNHKDVVESLVSGNKDFLYEAFNKALFDLQMMNDRFTVYAPRAASVLNDLDAVGRLGDWLAFPFQSFVKGSNAQSSNPTSSPLIAEWLKNYGTQQDPKTQQDTNKPQGPQGTQEKKVPPSSADLEKLGIPALLGIYITDVRDFTSAINVGFDPLTPNSYSYYLYKLREGMTVLGSWVLPLLYGMLGAVIFHMRRLLDPTVPDPSWLRFAYRIVLGGFAGIILVWFWTPSSQKVSQPEFATLTSFGLAFLVGFSTDVFFQALDRLVNYLAQAVGQAAT